MFRQSLRPEMLGGLLDWTTTGGAAALNAEVTRQSLMIAYLNDFRLMMYLTLFAVPLRLLLSNLASITSSPIRRSRC